VRLLLDTHVVLWWLADDRRLRSPEREAIADPESVAHVSAATVWEISIKRRIGRINLDDDVFVRQLETEGFVELPVRWRHARTAAALPRHHDDPFDRMLVAQAQMEGLSLVSYDAVFPRYAVSLLPSS